MCVHHSSNKGQQNAHDQSNSFVETTTLSTLRASTRNQPRNGNARNFTAILPIVIKATSMLCIFSSSSLPNNKLTTVSNMKVYLKRNNCVRMCYQISIYIVYRSGWYLEYRVEAPLQLWKVNWSSRYHGWPWVYHSEINYHFQGATV